jgi:hypothetical protein
LAATQEQRIDLQKLPGLQVAKARLEVGERKPLVFHPLD